MTNTWGLNASQMQLVQQASQPYINEDNVAHGQMRLERAFKSVFGSLMVVKAALL